MSYKQIQTAGFTDQELLERIKNDNKDAFKELFHKHYKQVYYLVYKSTGDEQLCASIIHDIFLQLWENRHNPTISSLDVYLFALTSTKIFEFVNTSKAEPHTAMSSTFKEKLLNLCSGLKSRRSTGWHWNSSQN